MPRIYRLAYLLFLALITVSCSSGGSGFKLEGRFLNLNQGEFYVYSIDGAIGGLDTVMFDGGRFSRTFDCRRSGTLMIVFPNYSEQPVFAEPGKSVTVSADASHLKEMEVKGTKDNERMTRFRKESGDMSPPDVQALAEKYIREKPQSPVSIYLLRRYFLQTASPDYAKARELVTIMADHPDENGNIMRLQQEVTLSATSVTGSVMPQFTGTDIYGNAFDSQSLKGKISVIMCVGTWCFESMNQQRAMRILQKKNPGKLNIVSLSIDADKKDIEKRTQRDSITWPVLFDGEMFAGDAVRQTGLCRMPDNMIVNSDGRIIARGLATSNLIEEVGNLLKE